MKNPPYKYEIMLFFMSFLFGVSYIATKIALGNLGLFQVIFGRYLLAFVFLAAVAVKKRHLLHLKPGDWKPFLLLAIIEPVGYLILETLGVRFASPANVALVVATIPVFAVIFAAFLLNEKPTLLSGFGILLSVAGVIIVVSLQQSSRLAPRPVLGSVITFGAAILAGLYNSLARRLARRYHPFTITFYQTMIAAIAFLPMALADYWITGKFNLDLSSITSLLFLSLGASVLAFYILNFALSRIGAAEVAVFSNFIPVFAIIASYLVFKEVLHTGQFLGAGLILIGIYFTFQRKPVS